MLGLNEVAPEFAPAWLGTAFLRGLAEDYDGALQAAKRALRQEPESVEAMLYIVTLSLTTGDYSAAGTYLGEVGERIELGRVVSPHVPRFYKMQLARYQSRGG
jgi:predicted Zn-dependent protease